MSDLCMILACRYLQAPGMTVTVVVPGEDHILGEITVPTCKGHALASDRISRASIETVDLPEPTDG